MKIICAQCKREYEKQVENDPGAPSHGICARCYVTDYKGVSVEEARHDHELLDDLKSAIRGEMEKNIVWNGPEKVCPPEESIFFNELKGQVETEMRIGNKK